MCVYVEILISFIGNNIQSVNLNLNQKKFMRENQTSNMSLGPLAQYHYLHGFVSVCWFCWHCLFGRCHPRVSITRCVLCMSWRRGRTRKAQVGTTRYREIYLYTGRYKLYTGKCTLYTGRYKQIQVNVLCTQVDTNRYR